MSPVTAEDEFLLALTAVRATYGPASASEDDLKDIVATEESRIADAAVLADLISARLSSIQPLTPAAQLAENAAHATETKTTSNLPTPIPFPTGGGSTPPLSIADLIDGMLTQERRDVRTTTKR